MGKQSKVAANDRGKRRKNEAVGLRQGRSNQSIGKRQDNSSLKGAAHSFPAAQVSKPSRHEQVMMKASGTQLLSITDRPEAQLTPLEKVHLVEQGISKKALQNLKEKADLDYDQLAKVLNVARGTLISKKGNERFNKDVSDKILGLADIYSYGYEVFEDQDAFNEWIFQPNKAIGGQAPFDLLHTSFGKEEVKNIIGRIDYGVYS